MNVEAAVVNVFTISGENLRIDDLSKCLKLFYNEATIILGKLSGKSLPGDIYISKTFADTYDSFSSNLIEDSQQAENQLLRLEINQKGNFF